VKNPNVLVLVCLAIIAIILFFANQHDNPPPLATPPPPSRSDRIFVDVPSSNPYWLFVEAAVNQGILAGYKCGSPNEPCIAPGNKPYFRPDSAVTRSQLARILSNAQHYSEVVPPAQQTFADVPPTDPFWTFIERVAQHGVLTGFPCGGAAEPCDPLRRPYFRRATSVTRGDLAAAVALVKGYTARPTAQTFADVPPSAAFYRPVEQVVRQGLLFSFPCAGSAAPCDAQNRPYFRPEIAMTRAELTELIFLMD
jgi:hypothetical protein